MALIPFPDIPPFPGVPPIPRLPDIPDFGSFIPTIPNPAGFISGAVGGIVNTALGALGGILGRAFSAGPQWGIFDKNGKPIGDAQKYSGLIAIALSTLGFGATQSTGAVEFSKETRISDFPIERGSFASYNKVELPAGPVVTLCLQGSIADRTAFLKSIAAAVKSTDLYSVVTPEVVYVNYSLERYNYQRRNSKGATLLIVEIELKEIRQVTSQYIQTNPAAVPIEAPKNPGATPVADGGKVQPQIPDVSTLKSIADKVPNLAATANSFIQNKLPF